VNVCIRMRVKESFMKRVRERVRVRPVLMVLLIHFLKDRYARLRIGLGV
jgi:hypothetical protein